MHRTDNEFRIALTHRLALGFALAVFLMHVATNVSTPYEFHRDEFLYLAMGQHLRLWHMDFPPFIAIAGRLSQAVFGANLAGIRVAPALAHATIVGVTVWSAALFGGRPSAQALAGLAVATSPLFLRAGSLFQPVTFEQLWWTFALLALAVRIQSRDPKHWLGVGIFLGLGALTKFSVVFLAAGVLLALVLTPLRRDLGTRWPWLGLMAAIVVGHPSLAGQIALGWPVRGQMADLAASQLARVGPLDFLAGQLSAGPIVLLALLGVAYALAPGRFADAARRAAPPDRADGDRRVNGRPDGDTDPNSRLGTAGGTRPATDRNWRPDKDIGSIIDHDWRPIGIATLTPFVLLLLLHGKAYYAGPIYPLLAAMGAAALDRLSAVLAPRRPTKVLALAAAIVAVYGMAVLPFGLPVLEPGLMAQYATLVGPRGATVTNRGVSLPLPQDYADMLGWRAMVDTVARVWRTMPPADTAGAIVVATNYGRAGAIDLLGRAAGLPGAISPVGSYWFFGPGTRAGTTAVVVADSAAQLRPFFDDVTEAARTANLWGVPEEQSVGVYVCRRPTRPLAEIWPSLSGRN